MGGVIVNSALGQARDIPPSFGAKEVSKYLIIMRLGRIKIRLTHSAIFQVM